MQCKHWLTLKHLQVSKRGRQKSNEKQREAYKARKIKTKSSPSEALATFRYLAHSVPKAANFFINA
jgi:hypothetical protein